MNNSKPGLIIIAVTAFIWGVSPNGVFAQNQTAGSEGSESALEEISKFANADGGNVFQFSADQRTISLTHQKTTARPPTVHKLR